MSTRICEIVTNLKDSDGKDLINLGRMNKVLQSKTCILRYAYIIHDKDTYTVDDEEKNNLHKAGSLKAAHIHLLLKFHCPQQYNFIAQWFGVSENYVQKVKSEAAATAYLIHANAPEKYQYSLNEVTANFDISATIQKVNTQKNLNVILDKITKGIICEYNKTLEIDHLLLVNESRRINEAFRVRAEHLLATQKDRTTECIFITGTSGAGKTTLAKKIAQEKHLAYYISSGSNDILDGYMQQPVLILDDMRPSALGLSDLLKMLDNNTASSVKSRYKNKVLYCQLIIITTVLDIDTFYTNVFQNDNEPITQLKRRCGTYIRMDHHSINVSVWDSYTGDYTQSITYDNNITSTYKPDHAKTFEDITNSISYLMPFLKQATPDNNGFLSISDNEIPFDDK